MHLQTQVQLQHLNTLHLNVLASHYVKIQSQQDIIDALAYAQQYQLNIVILSGGSNMLLPAALNALVMHMDILGIEILSENDTHVTIAVGAGQNWHEFVLWSTAQGYYGLQNLALIPGLVGASPVQNIGAYGVEVGEFIEAVEVYDRQFAKISLIAAHDCQFAYRHSIFKDHPQRYIITRVIFKLNKQAHLVLGYGDLKQAVADEQTPENLQQQVIQIRQSKLPNPQEFPNVGSFFKNPIISVADFHKLAEIYPHIPHYAQPNQQVKLAAGWLIDQAGWKGKQLGQVGMFHKQALVLVNYGQATLADVQRTYQAVQHDVWQKFNIRLEPEPVLWTENGLIHAHVEAE